MTVKGDSCTPELLLLVEPDGIEGVQLQPSVLSVREGIAYVQLTNPTGFTQHLTEGAELGTATEATVVSPGEPQCMHPRQCYHSCQL